MAQEALKQVHEKVKSVLAEDVSTWTKVETKTEGATLCERIDGASKVSPHPELRVGRAQMTIEASPSVVLDVVWNLEAMRNWDGPTIADAKLVDEIEKDKTQVVYSTHKTLSAAVAKRDVVYARSVEKSGDHILVYGVSVPHDKQPAGQNGFLRAELIYFGIDIAPLNDNQSLVTYLSCFDFCGWLHQKFHDQEIIRNAQRLGKIRQLALAKK
eukprot:TRINITY_DN1638_c0_g1_i1.p1 TRINITY_DN1638_c0_g1~~TRINITY_DN1638_c0_g1_i1.p1  ORF type:complete len:213 (+),score=55.85 TRINITY_DN1638_c0_g1_i1:35-673(+)